MHLPGLRRSPSAPVRLSCDDLSYTFLVYDDPHPHQSDYPVMTCRGPLWPVRTSQISLRWLVVHLLGLRRSPSAPVRLPCDDLSCTFLAYDDLHPHQSDYPVMTCRTPSWSTTIPIRTSQIILWWLVAGLYGPSAPVRFPCNDLSYTFLVYDDPHPHQSDYPVMTCRAPSWPTTISIRTSQIILWWLVVHLLGLRRSPSAPVRLSCDDLSRAFMARPHQSDSPAMTCRTPSRSTTIPIRTSQIILWWLVVGLPGPSAPVRFPCDDLSYTFLVYDDPHPHQSDYPVMTCRGPLWPVRTSQISLRWLVVHLPGLRRAPSAPVSQPCDDLSYTFLVYADTLRISQITLWLSWAFLADADTCPHQSDTLWWLVVHLPGLRRSPSAPVKLPCDDLSYTFLAYDNPTNTSYSIVVTAHDTTDFYEIVVCSHWCDYLRHNFASRRVVGDRSSVYWTSFRAPVQIRGAFIFTTHPPWLDKRYWGQQQNNIIPNISVLQFLLYFEEQYKREYFKDAIIVITVYGFSQT